jgi:hypothetical protein
MGADRCQPRPHPRTSVLIRGWSVFSFASIRGCHSRFVFALFHKFSLSIRGVERKTVNDHGSLLLA